MNKKKTFLIALTIVLIIILLIVIALNTINFNKAVDSNKDEKSSGEVLDLSDKVEGLVDTPDEYAYLLESVYGEKNHTFKLIREEEKEIIFKKVNKKDEIKEVYVVDKDTFEIKAYNKDTAMDNKIIEDTRPKEKIESNEDISIIGGA